MKSFLAVFENVHHDVLRMELGCRSLSSWMAQRALEYGFRLQPMPVDRLPAAVNAAVWQRVQGANRPRLCKEELVWVEKERKKERKKWRESLSPKAMGPRAVAGGLCT
jgi:hypothetical protein